MTMGLIKKIFSIPVLWIFVIYYYCSSERHKIRMDLDRFYMVHRGHKPNNYMIAFINEFVGFREFRSLFYCRIGRWVKLFSWLMPGEPMLVFGALSKNIGGGLFIQHGYATDIEAKRIGENCWINQKVTIAFRGNECPTIGNNVHIGAGAIIIGNVRIGNNVNIGAGAIIVKDVPDNCTVVSPMSFIIKRDGKRVHEELK
jgi:serine O-acetyltransferase